MPVAGRLVGLIRDGLPAGETVGVALSGGGDSTALLHLCLRAGLRVEAVTVDHRLRPESADEAVSVGAMCAALGVRHEIRIWEHGVVPGNLMDQARRARIGLIADWARSRGIGVVALGQDRLPKGVAAPASRDELAERFRPKGGTEGVDEAALRALGYVE